MAYFQRVNGKIKVYYYDTTKKKSVQLKRTLCRHLDGLADAEIKGWIEGWEKAHGRKRARIAQKIVLTTEVLHQISRRYIYERCSENGLKLPRVKIEIRYFDGFIFPYFVGHKKTKDVKKWHKLGAGFRSWLTETTDLQNSTKKQIIQCLNRFGLWLAEQGLIDTAWTFRTPKAAGPRSQRITPLPRPLAPDEVLAASRQLLSTGHPRWALATALGYFALLRPGETMALSRGDFLTGEAAVANSYTYDRLLKYGLGTKLAVEITKAVPSGREISTPKNYQSNGVVTIWHVDGARLIAGILSDLPEHPFIFTNPDDKNLMIYTKTHLVGMYDELVRPLLRVTQHDLRRAAGLYLGRGHHGLDPFLLQDMLRHGDIETTMLYTRRPRHQRVLAGQQNFKDII